MAYIYPFATADETTKIAVWEKGRPIVGEDGKTWDKSVWRWDVRGIPMKFDEHGNTDSNHGWEIDHIIPTAKGGSNDLSNLQPLNWRINREKGDTYPWNCPT